MRSDFIFVEDMVRGLLACAERGQPGEVDNLATGVETTILELATIRSGQVVYYGNHENRSEL